MRKKVWMSWLLGGAILLLIGGCIGSYMMTERVERVQTDLIFLGSAGEQSIELKLWTDGDTKESYLFVPSWFAGEESQFTLSYPQTMGYVFIDDKLYYSGDVWTDTGEEKEHKIEIRDLWNQQNIIQTMQVLASANLPSVFVAVEAEDDIISMVEFDNKQYLETGYLEIRGADGSILVQEKLERFKVRGNSTALCDKKPFLLEFEKSVSVLGMEEAQKWNLLANAMDGSYIRNKIALDMANECCEQYEPQAEFVDLYLNGVYQGLYTLTEAVEIGENRIEIDAGENWFVEMELDFRAREDYTQTITEEGQIFIVHSQKGVSSYELDEIEKALNDTEKALFAEDGISQDSGKALDELIDLDSFAESWLMQELTGNHDTGIASQTMYRLKEKDALWYSGPVWDFDCIMKNVNTPFYAIPENLSTALIKDAKYRNLWLSSMWNHESFRKLAAEKYINVFREKYEKLLTDEINAHEELIRRSAVLDAFRWHEERIGWWITIPEGVKQNNDAQEYTEYDTLDICIREIEDFIARKLNFLDKLWIEEREFCVVEIRNPAEFLDQGYNQTLYFWVEKGTAIENIPCIEGEGYRFEGYYDIDTGELVENGTMIEYDRIIEGRWTGGDTE